MIFILSKCYRTFALICTLFLSKFPEDTVPLIQRGEVNYVVKSENIPYFILFFSTFHRADIA